MAAAFMLAGIAGGDPAVARDNLFGGVVEASSCHRPGERHRIPIFAIVGNTWMYKYL
jgi:hypothetical protein